MQGVGGEFGRVELGVAQPAQLGRDLGGAETRGVEQARATHQLDRGAAGRHRRAATARVETGVEDLPVGTVARHLDGDADQIAARGAPGCARARVLGRVAASERIFHVLSQRLDGHPVECKDLGALGELLAASSLGAIARPGSARAGQLLASRASRTACCKENTSVSPVSVLTTLWRLTIRIVGV